MGNEDIMVLLEVLEKLEVDNKKLGEAFKGKNNQLHGYFNGRADGYSNVSAMIKNVFEF